VTNHRWKFYRAGGLDQVVFRNGQDIVSLRELDQKLWVTLACPTQGLDLDERTLSLIDTDKDGRIRPPELIATVEWLRDVYNNPDELMTSRDFVPLSSISDKTEAGRALLSTARRVLERVGRPNATQIELADVMDRAKLEADVAGNGDGIVPPEASPDPDVQKAIADVLATHGKSTDRSGKDGITQAHIDAFFADAAAYLAWHKKAAGSRELLPLGDATAAAASAVHAVRAKVEDFFTRCRLAAFDPRTLAVLTGTEAEFAAVASRELGTFPAELTRLPLARVEADRALPLLSGTNPAWAAQLKALADLVVTPLFGQSRTALSPADWSALTAKLAAYEAWQAEKPATKIESLGPDRIKQLVEGGFQAKLTALIAADAALAPEFARIEEIEKLIRCQRDLLRLLNNFVSFAEFYGSKGTTFLAGTLYLDERACHLCVPVQDAGKHGLLASHSKTYLAYCDLSRAGGEKQSIVAAFTNGDVDNLMVGRNGVFYDRKGRDWDATITQILDNPLSLRQAFWSPYKSLVRMIDEQVAKRAAAAEADSKKQIEAAALSTAQADKTKIGETKTEKKTIDVGTVAAIGVAVGGIATFLTAVLAMFFGLGWWMPLGFLGLMLAISGPAMFVAWLKLRQRNLGPILDANGWAVNSRVKITPLFASVLTDLRHLPPHSERALKDPFGQPPRRWSLYIFALVILGIGLAWFTGKIDPLLPERVKSTTVLGTKAPAYRPPVDSLDRKQPTT
jgi:hypothetical protein